MLARHQWLIPVILASQEIEIRMIMVQSQLGQIVCKPYLKKQNKTKKLIIKKVWWNSSRCMP
jgi:hypothetical protein